jgi:hypothetical protein
VIEKVDAAEALGGVRVYANGLLSGEINVERNDY